MAKQKPRGRIAKFFDVIRNGQESSAREEMLEEMFHDMYRNRSRVYKVNFVRGIFFGLGSVLGGTVVLAVILWIFSWFVDVPLIGEWLRRIIDSIPSR